MKKGELNHEGVVPGDLVEITTFSCVYATYDTVNEWREAGIAAPEHHGLGIVVAVLKPDQFRSKYACVVFSDGSTRWLASENLYVYARVTGGKENSKKRRPSRAWRPGTER